MYCRNCGQEISDQASVCVHCGTAVNNRAKSETNTIAIIGFILSFFVSIAGLICSIIGYRNARDNDTDGKGLALAGIIISAIKIAVSVFVIIIYVAMIIALITAV